MRVAAGDWGVDSGYVDDQGTWRAHPPATVAAVLEAMAATREGPPPSPVRVVRVGQAVPLRAPADLVTEDGAHVRVAGALPADLAVGYHSLTDLESGASTTLIVSPGRCPLPAGRRWGWAVQAYALRSATSWGMGDLADLADLGRWASGLGASILLINPLHAALPALPQTASPYYPSSRRFRNPLYVSIEDVPGAPELGVDLTTLAQAGRALNADRRIDRDRVYRLKMAALELVWERGVDVSALDRWIADEGPALEAYAAFCVMVERLGPRWREWPAAYRHPGNPEVGRFRREHADRARFHAWLQWLLDRQLAAAARTIPLMADLAVGVDPDGADAWLWQDTFAPGMSVGAPPDEFNRRGQDWGLPPFDPWRLRQARYAPFIETVRAALGHAGGLRVDHVMGLFRLFWIPTGQEATTGAYVRYPGSDLLAILAVEAQRAGAFAVGEDLGTVSDEIRRALAAADVCSTRLAWFEDCPPSTFPVKALAALTTHDLPTAAGLWTGADLAAQRAIGVAPGDESAVAVRRRLASLAAVDGQAPLDEVIVRAHRALATAPSLLVTATLDDALAVTERPNMPGTVDEWPNWSLALPRTLDEITTDPLAVAVADALENGGPPR